MKLSRSRAATLFLSLQGEPIRFDKHPYMYMVLDSTADRKLLKCSRQVGKSVIDSVELLIDMAFTNIPRKELREVYVTPSLIQTQQFSVEKLAPMIDSSERFRELFIDKNSRTDVYLKTFANGAQIFLRAANRNADRVRGIPADKIVIDEVQDILPTSVPDIIASAFASPYNKIVETGTPKTEDNFIEDEWQNAIQYEWAVPCEHHTPVYWNVGLDESNIGKEFLICKKCGKQLNPLQGRWVKIKSTGFLEGFHVNQLAAYLNMNPKRWHENIVQYYETWPEDKFKNEILGLSSGRAAQVLTFEDLKQNEYPSQSSILDLHTPLENPPQRRIQWFAGVDWGEGRDGGGFTETGKKRFASYTILIIGGYQPDGKFVVPYWKKFKGEETSPEYIVKFIIDKCQKWGITQIACDWGHGWGVNEQLFRTLSPNRVFTIYESSSLNEVYSWDRDAWRYTINRNELISRIVNGIKRKEFVFAKGIDGMYPDFTALRTEYSEQLRKIKFIHRVDEPDDSVHALLYCKFAADISLGKLASMR